MIRFLLFSTFTCVITATSNYENPNAEAAPEIVEYKTLVAEDVYGVPKSNEYKKPEYKRPTYYQDSGYGSGYGSQADGKCRKIKQLDVRGHRTARAKFIEFERDYKTYTSISCPNSGKPYALVATKEGADTIFNFDSDVVLQDTILLASGFNLDFTARCNERSNVARAYNGRKVSIKRVACVELPHPNPVTEY